ncbi:MAG: thymidine kinase [Rhabdochlamydiaceae bacterium]|nr:thymidine kinase [Rhabdochlamydiaceae bacterium]
MAKLYFYYSAMNAGKSTTLLQSAYNYVERGMQTLLFAPSIDNRFNKVAVHSRIGLTQEANGFDETTDFFACISSLQENLPNLKCILVDEAHFLKKKQIKQLTQVTTELRLPVLCYGLRSDFKGEPFEGSSYLLAWAEELIEIKTICHCGKKATMNIRIDATGQAIEEGNQVQIGGNESYISSCMLHFRQDNKTFAQDRTTLETPCTQQ